MGDFDVKVRIQVLDPSDPWAKAGLMAGNTTAGRSFPGDRQGAGHTTNEPPAFLAVRPRILTQPEDSSQKTAFKKPKERNAEREKGYCADWSGGTIAASRSSALHPPDLRKSFWRGELREPA